MQKSKTIWIVVTLSILTVCVYGYLYYNLVAQSDVESRLVGTVVRQLLPDLRPPSSISNTANPSPNKGEVITVTGIPFTPVGSGMPGACGYFTLQKCLAFYLGAEVRAKPDVLYKFVELARNVCGSIDKSVSRDTASTVEMKKYFECGIPTEAKPIVLINLVEGMDGEPRKEVLPDGGVLYSGRDLKIAYQLIVKNN